jgi:hypothetical protein
VLLTSSCTINSWTVRISQPFSSNRVAKECRNVYGLPRLVIPNCNAALRTAPSSTLSSRWCRRVTLVIRSIERFEAGKSYCQICDELLDLCSTHLHRMALVVEQNVVSYPVDVTLFGAVGVMLYAHGLTYLVKQFLWFFVHLIVQINHYILQGATNHILTYCSLVNIVYLHNTLPLLNDKNEVLDSMNLLQPIPPIIIGVTKLRNRNPDS